MKTVPPFFPLSKLALMFGEECHNLLANISVLIDGVSKKTLLVGGKKHVYAET